MILHALKILAGELNNYLNSIEQVATDNVVIGDIAQFESNEHRPNATPNSTVRDQIILSLIKLEEDKVLKNNPGFTTRLPDASIAYHNPPLNVNLYVLFSFNNFIYENALVYLSRVVRFFQQKHVFTHLNTSVPFTGNEVDKLEQFKLIMDLFSPSFEEANYLWSILGGRQIPFVMYRVRMLELELTKFDEVRGTISTITLDGKGKE